MGLPYTKKMGCQEDTRYMEENLFHSNVKAFVQYHPFARMSSEKSIVHKIILVVYVSARKPKLIFFICSPRESFLKHNISLI
mmetsp:Transcript_6846/g.13654  ORF Transcript_6846/g.13654 Transcript_6846/m.13654 type:complete len:82 (-) Transcript_6846:1260-1505(-)